MANESQRFWSKVDKCDPNECWIWTGGTAGAGYGSMRFGPTHRKRYAHRISYEMHHGPIPEGLKVLHSCDNPKCVNPAHLSVGTQADNLRDMTAKGRRASGRAFGEAKSRITRATVDSIRELAADGAAAKDLAEKFGVSLRHTYSILNGERRV